MDILGTYIVDDLTFILSSIVIICYFFFLTNATKKEKWLYAFIFILFNSSYNSHFVRVTNYNLVTLRTFLWAYKLVWKFTILDILFIIYLIVNVVRLPKLLKENQFVKVLFLGDILLLVLGTFSYFLFGSYRIDSFSHYFICIKVLIYALTIFIMASKVMKHRINIIYPMFYILLFGFLGMKFTHADVGIKIRYGIYSVVSDQEDMCTLSLFIVIYFSIYFAIRLINHKKVFKKSNLFNFIIFLFCFVQFALCMSKAAFVYYIASMLIFCFLYYQKTKRFILYVVGGMIVIVLVFHKAIADMLFSTAIVTRFLQVFDFVDYMNAVSAFSQVVGLGYGSPYLSTRATFDPGEIKDIDLNKYGDYKFDVQTPIVSVFKEVGFLGTVIFIINRIIFVSRLVKISKCFTSITNCSDYNVENISIIVYLIPICFTLYFFHTSIVAFVIFLIFLLVKLNFNLNYNKKFSKKVCAYE